MSYVSHDITAYISTKDRYFSTLPLALTSVISQTIKPKYFILFDDGEHKDLRKEPMYASIFKLFDVNNIEWRVEFSSGTGQVANHQRALGICKTKYLWRLDDDNIAEPDVLEKLLDAMSDKDIGAVGGCVLDTNKEPIHNPGFASSKIEDIYLGLNEQWFTYTGGDRQVDHLYSTFLYRTDAGKHGYCKELSRVGHREETLFTYEMKRAGWKVVFRPSAITWHSRCDTGGIRNNNGDLWAHDEEIFKNKLNNWGVVTNQHKIFVNETGLGDHLAMAQAIKKNLDKIDVNKCIAFVTYPGILNEFGIKEYSIADAKNLFGNIDRYNIYAYMIDHKWGNKLNEAYEAMYFGGSNV